MSEIKQLPEGKLRIIVDDFAGYNAKQSPYTKLGINEFPVMDNYYMNKGNEMLIKRDGARRFITAIGTAGETIQSLYQHRTKSGNDFLMIKNSTTLYYTDIAGIDPAGASYTTLSTNEVTGRYDFLSYQDRLYIANRTGKYNAVWKGSTSLYEMGCVPCNNTGITLAQPGAGNLVAGTYYYAVTFLYEDSQESAPLLWWKFLTDYNYYPRIVVSGSKYVTLANIPLGNARVTKRKIYRSKVNDATDYYYLTTIENNTDTTYTDNKADADLSTLIDPIIFSDMGRPYRSKYQTVHKEVMLQGNLTETLYTSDSTVAVAQSMSGGAMNTGAVYKYRFYKAWIVNTGATKPHFILSPYVEKQVTTTGSGSIDISLTGDGWNGIMFIERTSGGGSDFLWLPITQMFGERVTGASQTFNDGVADGGRIATGIYEGYITMEIIGQTVPTTFPSYVSGSDALKPDSFSSIEFDANGLLVPTSGTYKVGDDDREEITGMFSEYNRVVVFKENNICVISTGNQTKNFWVTNTIVKGIGADHRGIVALPNIGYFFVKTRNDYSGHGSLVFYLWDGQSLPVEVSTKIDTLLHNASSFTVYDLAYDTKANWVYVTLLNSSNSRRYVLIYDLKLSGWYVWYNSVAELKTKALVYHDQYGILIGTDYSSVHRFKEDTLYDEIYNTVLTAWEDDTIKTAWQLKTLYFDDVDFDLDKIRVAIQSGSASVTMGMISKINDDSESSAQFFTAVASGKLKRPSLRLRGNCSHCYFRFENTDASKHRILGLILDIIPRHQEAGGKP